MIILRDGNEVAVVVHLSHLLLALGRENGSDALPDCRARECNLRSRDRLDAKLARPFTSNLDRFLLAADNFGAGAFWGSSMSQRAQAGDLAGACDALPMWNKARVSGVLQVVRGLDRRRAAEEVLPPL